MLLVGGERSTHDLDILVKCRKTIDKNILHEFMMQRADQFYKTHKLILHIFIYGKSIVRELFTVYDKVNDLNVIGILTSGKPRHRIWDQVRLIIRSMFRRRFTSRMISMMSMHQYITDLAILTEMASDRRDSMVNEIQDLCTVNAYTIPSLCRILKHKGFAKVYT